MAKVGRLYKHYKNETIYEVIALAKHSEDLSDLVIYKDPKGNTWARPTKMFDEEVEHNGEMVQRFNPVI